MISDDTLLCKSPHPLNPPLQDGEREKIEEKGAKPPSLKLLLPLPLNLLGEGGKGNRVNAFKKIQ
jgi:hypothetical protein